MILKAEDVANYIERDENSKIQDPLVISPHADLKSIRQSGSASIDLRLGTWFVKLKQAKMSELKVGGNESQAQLTETHYVPFGDEYFLHPQAFVLGITLEWIRLPNNLCAYVIGKSSWGRRGLIIATATGVHPGFKGCLTLELTNIGEVAIPIQPGMEICQIFIHEVRGPVSEYIDNSQFAGSRRPRLGKIKRDSIAEKLKTALSD